MRVLITTQVFPPEVHPTAVMVMQLARHLQQEGHEVFVVAGHPHHPYGSLPSGWRRRLIQRERIDGVVVLRGWHVVTTCSQLFSRAIVMVSQAFSCFLVGLTAPPPHVVVNFGPPLVGPVLSSLLARRFRAQSVAVIYDLYPDIALEGGKLSNPLVIGVARWMERVAYRLADKVIVLSPGFRRAMVERGVPLSKLAVVPVWLDPDEISPRQRETAWRAEHGIGVTTQIILYAGTIGLISGADIMIEVAAAFLNQPNVLFLFVGEGRAKEGLAAEARRRGLDNMRFLPLQPRERLAEVQASSDISVVTLAPGRGHTSVPSKVVGYLAAGRPVLASVDSDSDTAYAILEGECGVVTIPGDAMALTLALRMLLSSPERCAVLGQNAREYFERTYAAPLVLAQMRGLLEELSASGVRNSV